MEARPPFSEESATTDAAPAAQAQARRRSGQPSVTAMALSADGQQVALCWTDGVVMVRRTGDGVIIRVWETGLMSFSVAFTPDGKHVITSEDGVFVRNVETGLIVRALPFLGSAVALVGDGDTLIGSDGTAFIIGRLDGKQMGKVAFSEPLLSYPIDVAVSLDGRTGVAGDYPSKRQQLCVFDLELGTPRRWLRMPPSMLYDLPAERAGQRPSPGATPVLLFLSSTGRLLSVTGSYGSSLYNFDSGRRRELLRCSEIGVSRVDFSHDESLLGATLFDGSVRIWSMPSGRLVEHREADSKEFDDVQMSVLSLDLGLFAANRYNGALSVTDLHNGNTKVFPADPTTTS